MDKQSSPIYRHTLYGTKVQIWLDEFILQWNLDVALPLQLVIWTKQQKQEFNKGLKAAFRLMIHQQLLHETSLNLFAMK